MIYFNKRKIHCPQKNIIDNRQSGNALQRYVIEKDGKYILSKTNSISSESEIAAVNNDRSTFVTIYDPDKLTFPAQKLLGNPRQFDTVYSHTYMENMVKIAKDKAQKNKTIPKTYLTDEQELDDTSWKTMKTYYNILKSFLESVQKQEVEKIKY